MGVNFCVARLPRFIIPGQPQHVIQRGNNRQAIFCTERDYVFKSAKLLNTLLLIIS